MTKQITKIRGSFWRGLVSLFSLLPLVYGRGRLRQPRRAKTVLYLRSFLALFEFSYCKSVRWPVGFLRVCAFLRLRWPLRIRGVISGMHEPTKARKIVKNRQNESWKSKRGWGTQNGAMNKQNREKSSRVFHRCIKIMEKQQSSWKVVCSIVDWWKIMKTQQKNRPRTIWTKMHNIYE